MTLKDEIKDCKAKIADLEYNLAIERAVLERLNRVMSNGEQTNKPEPRPIIPDSIVAPLLSVLNSAEKPMKVGELLEAIKREGFEFQGKTDPKRLISSALNRRKDLFERKGRGFYQLKNKDITVQIHED